MRKGPNSTLTTALSTPVNESGAVIPMPMAVREAVIDLLAQILVADYERFQGVIGPTVTTPSQVNRGLQLVKTGKKQG